jgi:hypothetical protein
MELFLSGKKTIQQINREFKKIFPYLRLEFSKYVQKPGLSSPCLEHFEKDTKLEQMKDNFTPASIFLDRFVTVAQLENRFQQEFGLSAQVFMKKNGGWVDAFYMDSYTLEDLNQMATRPVGMDLV